MNQPTQHIRYFLFSQYLSDGIRITLEILLPALIFSYVGRLEIGLLMSTGAFCVSISDAPGPPEHKRNGMMYCNLFVFLMVLITGFANHNVLLLGILIAVAAFFFTMLGVFGARAAAVGLAALLIMVLRMDEVQPAEAVLTDSLLVLAGGTWYMLIAILFNSVRPFRQAQRSLGNCIHETTRLLYIKAALYDSDVDLSAKYKQLLDQQVIVNESQDEVRQLLFKSKEIVKDSTPTGKMLLLAFTDVVDLYEQATATWFDYPLLRSKFGKTLILPQIASIINAIAMELDRIGFAIQSNTSYQAQLQLMPMLTELKSGIDELDTTQSGNMVLKKILINLRSLGERVDAVAHYFKKSRHKGTDNGHTLDYSQFVTHQEISFNELRNNFSLRASTFRHSLRMTITCVVGFMIVHFISYGHHSYWILLTILFILKPGYSLSKERNIQRIAGTIAGGAIGIIILLTITDRTVLFAFIVFFMIGTYTFQRLNYIVTVIFMTPYILVLFSFLGLGFINIVEERILDTAIASVLAFIASYFLFPHWESTQLETHLTGVLKANLGYLQKLKEHCAGQPLSVMEYKLARKEMYVNTANLFAAFTRMLSEPKHKQQFAPEINELVVLNNVLSSNIASLFIVNPVKEGQPVNKEIVHILQRSVSRMQEALRLMDNTYHLQEAEQRPNQVIADTVKPDAALKDHVDFVYKLVMDIRRVVEKITPKIPGGDTSPNKLPLLSPVAK